MLQIRIEDPSGETRYCRLECREHEPVRLGRAAEATIQLRDPTVQPIAARLWRDCTSETDATPVWIQADPQSPPIQIGDLQVREAALPLRMPLVIGETRLILEEQADQPPLPPAPKGLHPWLTSSENGAKLIWTARKAAATPLAIYLAGETGTGKEVIAHLIHAWSERASGPFVPLNCGALPLSLAESELFGHVKGAFTGAFNQRPGALMQAHGGTLFLDEVGDLPADIQVKLLRFLENGEIRPVGADRPSRADVRIICATHLPLTKLVEEGKFRRDLYYRLASVTLEIPPLRQRPEDIEMLANRFALDLDRNISPRAMLRLKAHTWPGNVRELRHAIERASGLAGPFAPVLNEESFDFLLNPEHIQKAPELELGPAALTLQEMERLMVIKALRIAGGNRTNAARILGIARSTLFEMLKRHKIRGPRSNTWIPDLS